MGTKASHPMVTRVRAGPRRLLSLQSDLVPAEPTSFFFFFFSKALKDPRWPAAMAEEFFALIANHTWDFYHMIHLKIELLVNGFIR